MADLWDAPANDIINPLSYHSTEGYPLPDGINVVPVYDEDGFSTQRAGKRLIGVDFYNGGAKLDTFNDHYTVEGGRYNLSRRLFFQTVHRLRRLTYLAIGPQYVDTILQSENVGAINFTDTFVFTTNESSGYASTFTLNWSSSGADPRKLSGTKDVPTSLQVGMPCVTDGVLTAEITGINYTSSTSATVTLNRPLHAIGSLTVWRENAIYPFPVLMLEPTSSELRSPPQCVHAVKVEHSAFSSFKATHGSQPLASGINGSYYCESMRAVNVDLSQFDATAGQPCNNTSCPLYQAVGCGGIETDDIINTFLFGRGTYMRQLAAGSADNSNFRLGRERYAGILTLLGFRTGYYPHELSLWLPSKEFEPEGIIYYDTGAIDEWGYKVFKNFHEHQLWLVDQGQEERDDVGILHELKSTQVAKEDPAEDGALNLNQPAYDYERAIGVRRTQAALPRETDHLTGAGMDGIQRVRPRVYTSPAFSLADTSQTDGETTVTLHSASRSEGNVTYDVTFQLPKFCNSTGGSKSGGTIYSMASHTDGVQIQFELGQVESYYTDPVNAPQTLLTSYWDCGGNVVRSDNAHESWNPAWQRGVGDRQSGLCIGDTIEFSAGTIGTIKLIVVAAEAYAGDEDTNARDPHPNVGGLPQYLRDNHRKRDRIVCALDPFGKTVAYVNSNPPSFPSVSAGQHAVSPINAVPSLKLVQGETVTSIPESAYTYDPATGTFYTTKAALGLQAGTDYKLCASVDVYDNRTTHSPRDFVALSRLMDAVVEHGWIAAEIDGDMYAARYRLIDSNDNIVDGPHFTLMSNWETLNPFNPSNPTDVVFSGVVIDAAPVQSFSSWQGFFVYEFEATWDTYYLFSFRHYSALREIRLGGICARLRGVELEKAYLNISCSNAIAQKVWVAADRSSGTSIVDGGVVDLSALDMSLQIYRGTVDGTRWSVAPVGGTISTSVSLQTDPDDGLVYARGTVECTEQIRMILNGAESGERYLIGPAIFDVNDTSDYLSLAKKCHGKFDTSFDGSGNLISYDIEAYRMQFESFSVGNLMVKVKPAGLTGGAIMHYGSAGQAHSPALID